MTAANHHPRQSDPRTRRRKGAWSRRCALIGLLLILAGNWFGCVTEKNYKVLSFFFDGVPDPNAPPVALDEFTADGQRVVRAVAFIHKPYAEGKCDACHTNATGSFDDYDKVDDATCLKCHQDVPDEWPRMHGPVALGQCGLCHQPHESSVPALLKDDPQKVCGTCHLTELLPAEPPDHFTNRNCLDCHLGHGGTDRGLLRIDFTPTTRESTPTMIPVPPPGAEP